MTTRDTLIDVTFGQRVAEDEVNELADYFVETDQWRRIFGGELDVVYGPKGSGKSAIYALLSNRTDHLFDRGVILAPAENPRGDPAFSTLVVDPPSSEREFVNLWKLYLLCVAAETMQDYGITTPRSRRALKVLEDEGLVKAGFSLIRILRNAFDYARRVEALEPGMSIDSATGAPTGVSTKISFREPSQRDRELGGVAINELFNDINSALDEHGISVWLALDRLDVAFADSIELEKNALRALFRVYLDLLQYNRIALKIFLRSDIWARITEEGFREASHITRHATIAWNETSLLNLIVRRILRNEAIRRLYEVDEEEVLSSVEEQRAFFYRMFPEQVDLGPNKPTTLDWMLSRTKDGAGTTAPREVIHLLSSLREVQLHRLEVGQGEPDGHELFERSAFKEALPDVSRVRLQQTLYAEQPDLKPYLESLHGEKTQQFPHTLGKIWGVQEDEAVRVAERLVEVGFFERRGSREAPSYWVPFLYRDALEMVQGSAE